MIWILLVVFLALLVWVLWGNRALMLSHLTVSSERLPKGFDGYRIAHLSDIHNTEYGKGNEKLLGMIKEAKPEIIVITGDLLDSRRTNMEKALRFTKGALEIAPCYYVMGNHEARNPAYYGDLKAKMTEQGVVVLDDKCVELERNGETIQLLGVNDASFEAGDPPLPYEEVMDGRLREIQRDEAAFTILLSHRPELFPTYAAHKLDLVFSGHAHGGQMQIPFIGGLIAPNQGFFPKYDKGLYTEGNTNMVVSRGIGNSLIPLRINNRPEVILVELKSGK